MSDPEKEKLEDAVDEVSVDEENQPEETVEVDLNDKSEDANLDEKLARLEERVEKSQKRNEYLNRQLQKAISQLNQPQSHIQKEEAKQEVREIKDELDEIAQQDWKKAVRMLGRQEAESYFNELTQKQQQQQQAQSKIEELEKSKQRVRDRYPDIDDDSSENAQIYMSILNENPTLLQNTYGPELAMYKMEERLREMGKQPAQVRQAIREEADRETQRRMRIGVSGLPKSVNSRNDKVVLTKQEADMAKELNIPLEEVAKLSKLAGRGFVEGVQVDE